MTEGQPKSLEEQIEEVFYPLDSEGVSRLGEFAGNPAISPEAIAVEGLKKKPDLPERDMDQN